MSRPVKPLWTAAPSRFAGRPRGVATTALVLLALGVLASLHASSGTGPGVDPAYYRGAIEAIPHGGFYPALAASLRAGGGSSDPLAFAPPTLAAIAAALPAWALAALYCVLAGAVFTVWRPTLRGELARSGSWAACLLLAAGLVPYLRIAADPTPRSWADLFSGLHIALLYLPEAWAGLLVALSLGFWARGGRVEAAAFGLAAGVVREVAGVYLVVMLLFALRSGDRQEAAAWGVAAAALAGVTTVHWRGAASEIGSLDGIEEHAFNGLGAFVRALSEATAIGFPPLGIAAALVVAALFGWIAWASPVGVRLAGTVAGLAVLYTAAPAADPAWAYLVAAPLPVGLAFAPDGLRDLVRAARGERRRITVTRVAR